MGRRKISMEKIDNLHARQICFSKRRKGLFSKAAELCNQGGGQVAILIFSSAGNLYCYGWPSVNSVVRRYFGHRFASAAAATGDMQGADDNNGGNPLPGTDQGGGGGGAWWWDVPVEGLELHELEVLHAMLEELKEKVTRRAAWLLGDRSGKVCLDQPSCVRRRPHSSAESQQATDPPPSNSKLCLELSLRPHC